MLHSEHLNTEQLEYEFIWILAILVQGYEW